MHRLTLITFGLSIAACSSSSTTPTREQYDDTAQAIAGATATQGGGGDVSSMSDGVAIALGAMPQGFSVMADGQIHGTRLGVDYRYAITCRTAAGVVAACGPTTDQATVEVAWSGDLRSTYVDASVTRSGSWSITGLGSSTAAFSGAGTFSFDTTLRSVFRPGATASYAFDASASYDAVEIATADRRVIGGSASFDVTAHAQVTGAGGSTAERSFEIHADITFHADHSADLVLDASRRYSLDLTSGLVVRVN